jgi:5-methyltetrahydrofolate--homocysteine methyltransferase
MMNQEPRLQTTSARWALLEPEALRMRRRPTRAENLLWQELRKKAVQGLKFRRQHAVGPFVVDFYCIKARLVIEVDGPIHSQQAAEDQERQDYLEGLGLTVLRFSNKEVLAGMPGVLERIDGQISLSKNPLSSQGEGVGGEVTHGG